MKKRSLKISLTNQIMIATVLGIFLGRFLSRFR